MHIFSSSLNNLFQAPQSVNNRIVISNWIQFQARSLPSCCLGTQYRELVATVALEHVPNISRIIDNTTPLRGWAFLHAGKEFFVNLRSKVEEHPASLGRNFSCPRLYRGTEGNFFMLFGSFYWCSWSGCARAALTWPATRQVPLPYGNQMEAGVEILSHRSEAPLLSRWNL